MWHRLVDRASRPHVVIAGLIAGALLLYLIAALVLYLWPGGIDRDHDYDGVRIVRT
jgi:hypothetical protein